eukprot:scaffold96668_cov97-Phaeocystis_antarctica.AAC.3
MYVLTHLCVRTLCRPATSTLSILRHYPVALQQQPSLVNAAAAKLWTDTWLQCASPPRGPCPKS